MERVPFAFVDIFRMGGSLFSIYLPCMLSQKAENIFISRKEKKKKNKYWPAVQGWRWEYAPLPTSEVSVLSYPFDFCCFLLLACLMHHSTTSYLYISDIATSRRTHSSRRRKAVLPLSSVLSIWSPVWDVVIYLRFYFFFNKIELFI